MQVAGSIAEVLEQEKRNREEYNKGYQDYIKEHQMSPYQQGQADAKRDMEEKERMNNFLDRFMYYL